MNTSAPATASASVPRSFLRLVTLAISACAAVSHSSPSATSPFLSAITTSAAPLSKSSLQIAIPALPAPQMTILTFAISLPHSLSALNSAAVTTIAVPC